MNSIEKMINELCLEGVKRVKLGEVCDFINGFAFKSNLFRIQGFPIIRITNINGTEVDLTDIKYFNKTDYNSSFEQYEVTKGQILIAMSGATTGKIGRYNQDIPAYLNQRVGKFVPGIKLTNNFLYHILKGKTEELYILAGGGAQPNLSTKAILDFEIPLPPLPIQEEIVRILDKCTDLIKNIDEEIALRQKQYEYYRNQLLGEKLEGVERVKLGEVCEVQRGASPRPISNYITDEIEGIPWIKIGDIKPNDKYITKTQERITLEGVKKSRLLHKGDFILSNSMSFGRPYILAIDGCIHDGWASLSGFEEKLSPDYLYQILNSSLVQKYWISKVNSGAVSNLNTDIIKSTEIPLPPLPIQESIVRKLDKFNEVIKNLEEERELRQKQYEHYREQLLSF